jgi:hypothetical protein
LDAVRLKNKLYGRYIKSPLNGKLKQKYCIARNRATQMLKDAKTSYYKDKFDSFSKASDMWKFLKNSIGLGSSAKD